MSRAIELGAGIAAAVLSVLGFAAVLFVPLVPYCAVSYTGQCPQASVRYTSALQAGLTAGAWGLLVGLLVLTLLGAAGAILDARTTTRGALVLLGIGAVLAFAVCAVAAGGVGVLFLPGVASLCLAVYASILRRLRTRTPPQDTSSGEPAEKVSGS